ncbi:amino acid ABC transporter permease [Actinomadura madurae]|uniref:amino acid ABC transporter permease n=1 Tax=Actinomadura madurae TaxID=1993 RepID=UPI0020D217AE|nr:amino acid ABC transporter permease [Actinomadura madurae]MCP9971307.1 amino acid ABC transporter permease [Actinomadura madurae]MCP9983797.1 amino acid ABC transporter permease [Actinomadura madurae]
MSREATVLFDIPGPRARARNTALTAIVSVVLVAIFAALVWRLNDKGQFESKLWTPFTEWTVWRHLLLPGLMNTLKAAAVATVLALLFGVVFGLARLSDHWWIRVPAGAVVEFFRGIPLLILIFLAFFVPNKISPTIAESPFGQLQRMSVDYFFSIFGVESNAGTVTVPAFAAVVFGLTMYNGSVLAEVVRAGVLSIPKGQSEAAYSIGLRKNGVMRLVLLPQAITVMMPAIVSQIVVLLKDTALGFIIAYGEFLQAGFKQVPANYSNNVLQAGIIVAIIYIAINMSLSRVATWLEARSRRSRKTEAKTMGTAARRRRPASGSPIRASRRSDGSLVREGRRRLRRRPSPSRRAGARAGRGRAAVLPAGFRPAALYLSDVKRPVMAPTDTRMRDDSCYDRSCDPPLRLMAFTHLCGRCRPRPAAPQFSHRRGR